MMAACMLDQRMRRISAIGLVFGLFVVGLPRAQAQGRTSLFVVSTDPGDEDLAVPILEGLTRELEERGATVVGPELEAVTEGASPALLEEARSLGSAALDDLSDNRTSSELRAKYDAKLGQLLRHASAIHGGEGRKLFWNLCVLRVQIFLLGGPAYASNARAGVHECRRLFPDQHEFSETWRPEVVKAFEQHAAKLPRVTLGVQSAPAGCEVRLYGATVGLTPMRTEVQPGPQEVQIRCGNRTSQLHKIEVTRPGDLIVRLDADAKSTEGPLGAMLLAYDTLDAANKSALDDARALATSAESDSLILISLGSRSVQLWWHDMANRRTHSVTLRADVTAAEHSRAIGELFEPKSALSTTPRSTVATSRSWADITLGSGLLFTGLATAAYAGADWARDGECANEGCSRVHVDHKGRQWALFAAGAALTSAGVFVLWRAPFKKRTGLEMGTSFQSVHVRGAF